MINSKNAGDGIVFREIYSNLFNGALSYPYENSYLSNAIQFSIYFNIIPITDSSRQVIFSSGELSSNTVSFDIGISTNNMLFFYNGTTETNVSSALTSGIEYKITITYSDNLINLYIDGLFVHSTSLSNINGIDIYVGKSIDASEEYYKGYINEISIYNRRHYYEELGVLSNTDSVWSPGEVANLAAWYEATDVDATLVKATQPTPDDWDMETAGVGQWNFSNATGLKAGPAPEGSQYMQVTATVSGGWANQSSKLIIGNRYTATAMAAGDDNLGIFRLQDGGAQTIILSTSSSAWQYLSGGEITANGTGLLLRHNSTGVFRVDDITVSNLSRTQWNPKAGSLGGNLAQATPVSQPWWDSTTAFLLGSNDEFNHSAVASTFTKFHDGSDSGGTLVVFVSNFAHEHPLIATCTAATANIGLNIKVQTDGSIRIRICNGSGVSYAVSRVTSSGIVSINTLFILSWSVVNGTDGVNLYINGVLAATGTLASPATGTPTNTLSILSDSVIDMDGGYGEVILVSPCVNTNRQKIEQYFASKYGITLP